MHKYCSLSENIISIIYMNCYARNIEGDNACIQKFGRWARYN